jgi:hypothetical protein
MSITVISVRIRHVSHYRHLSGLTVPTGGRHLENAHKSLRVC